MELQANPLHAPKIWMPSTIEAAVSLKQQFGQQSCYVAGATLLQLRWQKAQAMPSHLINLEQLSQLHDYQLDEKGLTIGALVKLSALRLDPTIKNAYPSLVDAIQSIAAPAVRNRGTVGGNIMGGEGDLIPLLLAMQAEMTFLHDNGLKTIDISEWLINRDADALLVKITIPTPCKTFYKKIGRRETFTAAILTVSGQIAYTDTQAIAQLALAIGGGGNIPLRLTKTEQYMIHKTIQQIDWKHVYESILDEYCPATDAFVTNNYKKKVAANLIISEIQRLWSTQLQREVHVREM